MHIRHALPGSTPRKPHGELRKIPDKIGARLSQYFPKWANPAVDDEAAHADLYRLLEAACAMRPEAAAEKQDQDGEP